MGLGKCQCCGGAVRLCDECGAQVPPSTGRPWRYCTTKCKLKAERRRYTHLREMGCSIKEATWGRSPGRYAKLVKEKQCTETVPAHQATQDSGS